MVNLVNALFGILLVLMVVLLVLLVQYYFVNSDGVDGALRLGASHRRPLKVTPLTLTAATAALQPAHYS